MTKNICVTLSMPQLIINSSLDYCRKPAINKYSFVVAQKSHSLLENVEEDIYCNK